MSDEYIVTVKANTKPAEESVQGFAGNFSEAITGVNQGLELVDKFLVKIKQGFDKVIDTALLGESTDAIGKRFEILARQAGQVPESLSFGIGKAIDGTVDMEDALLAASKAFVEIETQSAKIPQMFEVARKASQAFGGDTIQIFQDISKAIATGSTRSLRENTGLVIDAGAAYKKYANEIGVSVDLLSDLQKQEAIGNAILSKANEQFKNINGSITPLNESLKKNKVAWGDLYESSALLFNDTFGAMITNITNKMTAFVTKWTEFNNMNRSSSIPTTANDIAILSMQLSRLAEMKVSNPNLADFYQKQIDAITERLVKYRAEDRLTDEQLKASERTHQQRNTTLEESAKKISDTRTELEKLRKAQEEYERSISFAGNFEDELKRMSISIAKTGAIFARTFVVGFTNGFAAIGAAIVKGENALDAFGKAMLSAFGGALVQMGQGFIALGIAQLFVPGMQGAGAALIAAGAGVSVVGGVLQALGGGGSGTGAASASTSGANYSVTDSNSFDNQDMFQPPEDREREKARTGVTINVQGNILDRRETGLELAEILNSAFDTNGTLIRANA